MSACSTNYPINEPGGAVQKRAEKIKILRCVFTLFVELAEKGKEMHIFEKCTCRACKSYCFWSLNTEIFDVLVAVAFAVAVAVAVAHLKLPNFLHRGRLEQNSPEMRTTLGRLQ